MGLEKMEGSHTARNILESIQKVLLSWKIPEEKVLFYITDSGANIVTPLKESILEYSPLAQLEDLDEEGTEEIALFEQGDPNLDASFDGDEVDEFEMLEIDHNETFTTSKRLSCVCHRIACIVRNSVDNSTLLSPIIKAAFDLCAAINRSTRNKELLLKHNKRGLLSPAKTRWIYTCD